MLGWSGTALTSGVYVSGVSMCKMCNEILISVMDEDNVWLRLRIKVLQVTLELCMDFFLLKNKNPNFPSLTKNLRSIHLWILKVFIKTTTSSISLKEIFYIHLQFVIKISQPMTVVSNEP